MALWTVVQLEKHSGISRYTWRLWLKQGRLPVLRLGRRIRVAEEDYQQFLEENRITVPRK